MDLSSLCLTDICSLTNNHATTDYAKRLFVSTFAIDERREWKQVLEYCRDKKEFKFFVACENNRLSGIVSVWEFKRFAYIEHLAVDNQLRNRGIGSKILYLVKEKYRLPIVLEVEPPVDYITGKRVEFYKKNKFILLQNKYIQPPYATDKSSVEMKIMTTDVSLPFEYIKNTLYTANYGVLPQ